MTRPREHKDTLEVELPRGWVTVEYAFESPSDMYIDRVTVNQDEGTEGPETDLSSLEESLVMAKILTKVGEFYQEEAESGEERLW